MAKVLLILLTLSSFCCCLEAGSVNTETKQAHSSAKKYYLSKWNQISKLYQNDDKVRQAINQANWFHHERVAGRIDDPRPPPIDVPGVPFTCDPGLGISPEVPDSVHALRPGDINVVAALGDSITAGNGNGAEENVLQVIAENRGESWSVGGDFSLEMNVSTIPNMLKKFNPNLKGHSTCSTPNDDYGFAWFNVAVPGARADDLVDQAQDLITRMTSDDRIAYATDWKMITLFIGGNDFCSYCTDREDRTPAIFKQHVQDALDLLHDQVPRAFINLVPMAHVGPVQNVSFHWGNTSYPGEPEPPELYPFLCDLFHYIFCECVMNDTTRHELEVLQQDYFHAMKEIVDSRRYDDRDDFTVVLQPHLKDQVPMIDPLTGMTDNRYFSPDCFHPNRRMHQVFAYLLWNVMLTKVGEKPYNADVNDWPQYLCPTDEQPFLFTHVNSVDPPITDAACQTHSYMTTLVAMVMMAIYGYRETY